MKQFRKMFVFIMLLSVVWSLDCNAVRTQHDREKMRQWQSMELGPWDFAPGAYYVTFHNKYSGGNGNILRPRFKETKSDVKSVYEVRTQSAFTQKFKMKDVKAEKEKINDVLRMEVEAEADRLVDLVYSTYKEDFKVMQDKIKEGISFAYLKSKGKLKPVLDDIVADNDIVLASIEHLHKTGIEGQLENGRRKKGYEDAKEKMRKIVKRVYYVGRLANTLY